MLKVIIVKPDITKRQAMKKFTQSGRKCLLVIDDQKTLLGTLSDGDLRRSILRGASLSMPILEIYNTKPKVLIKGKYKIEEAKKLFTNNKFDLIPVVNEYGKLEDILLWETVLNDGEITQSKLLDVPVVIMAGGQGTRLAPFTHVLPKPLVPIHEKPVIEHIIERFTEVGVNEFILTINYKASIMKAYFEEMNPVYSVDFMKENKPLGTAGGLKFLEKRGYKYFIVTNCDTLIKADYSDLIKYHKKNKFDMTLVVSMKKFVIPYGACELNSKGHLKNIKEKPEYDFLVNIGLYVLDSNILKLIPENKIYHITHLIEDAQKKGKKIGVYPIDDDAWVDVGQWSEYKKAVDQL